MPLKTPLYNELSRSTLEPMETIRPLVIKALEHIRNHHHSSRTAIDFGIGCGEETSYLLRHGYRVIAIDNFEDFLSEIAEKEEVQPYRQNLTTIHSNFEDLKWTEIPQVDLFIASFSLCFVQPHQFHSVWSGIIDHIVPGGYFVGELYTHLQENTQIDGLYVTESCGFIPFFTKEEILILLESFEIVYFDEAQALYEPVNDDEPSEEGSIYSIIARKK